MIQLTENQREILQSMLDGKDIEVLSSSGGWYKVDSFYKFGTCLYFWHTLRVKPRTITVNGIEVPEPMKVKPDYGTKYYTATPEPETYVRWVDDSHDNEYFNDGICHSTPEAASLHWKAMIKPSRVNKG